MRRRADAGLASAADVALAEARTAQTRATLQRLATDVALADAELLALTQAPVPVGAPVPERYLVSAPLPELEALAVGTAPVLLRGERRVALARASAARERTRTRPTVYLEGRRDFGDDRDDDLAFGVVVEGGLDGIEARLANRKNEFLHTIYGGVNGTVAYVSADTIKQESPNGQETFYRVRVRPDSVPAVTTTGRTLEVQPGMTAQVDIRTGDRTLVDYLLKPLRKTLADSFGER